MQVAIILLVVFLAGLMIRYLIASLKEKTYHPAQWSNAIKEGKIGKALLEIEKTYDDKIRLYNFWFQCERLKKENISGSFAELGVYKGETARIIHLLDNSRKFHLFDTFDGFIKSDLQHETGEAATYSSKNFADTSEKEVVKFIEGNENIIVHKGHFPETTQGLEKEMFALVNIDADLCKPILEGLKFFYPHLSPGGVILVHDYNHKWEGALKAVDEFVSVIPENLVEIPDMHGTVMLIRNKTPG